MRNINIFSRTYTALTEEISLDKARSYLFDLSYKGIINCEGIKAQDYLQGQLTCDLRALSDTRMQQGLQCNLQGRIGAILDVISYNGIKLILPKDLIPATIKSFTKSAALSRVSMQENNALQIYGFYLQNASDLLPLNVTLPEDPYALLAMDDTCYYHLGQGFYIILIPQAKAQALTEPFIERKQYCGSLMWHTLRLQQGNVEIYPESRGLFLPHRLGFHKTPLISFNKGCYKGQEIIARMHYRSTVKHELVIEYYGGKDLVNAGEMLVDTNGNALGELVDYSILEDGSFVVGVVKNI